MAVGCGPSHDDLLSTSRSVLDVAVDSTGKIASCGIATGTFAHGGTSPSVTFSGFHGFVARFDP
jgi:hypothetical protein